MQFKNKPCVIYTVMRLIPWIQSQGRETGTMSQDKLPLDVSSVNLNWATDPSLTKAQI